MAGEQGEQPTSGRLGNIHDDLRRLMALLAMKAAAILLAVTAIVAILKIGL